jgi:hypothetical protein
VVTIAADAALRLARYRRRAHFSELAHQLVDGEITSWAEFYAAVADRPLLARLDDYRDPLLIDGCDWLAVTAIAHLFTRLHGFADPPRAARRRPLVAFPTRARAGALPGIRTGRKLAAPRGIAPREGLSRVHGEPDANARAQGTARRAYGHSRL